MFQLLISIPYYREFKRLTFKRTCNDKERKLTQMFNLFLRRPSINANRTLLLFQQCNTNQLTPQNLFKRQPHKMVKHTQKIRRMLPTNCADEFFECGLCDWRFVGLAFKRLILSCIMLKSGQTNFKNFQMFRRQDFLSMFDHFSTLCMKELRRND